MAEFTELSMSFDDVWAIINAIHERDAIARDDKLMDLAKQLSALMRPDLRDAYVALTCRLEFYR